MKQLNIEVPEGYEIDIVKSDLKAGGIVFKVVETKYPNNWVESEINSNREYAEAALALCQLIRLRDIYNDCIPIDWKDNASKYLIKIDFDKISYSSTECSSRVLAFHDIGQRSLFLKNFRSLIIIAIPLL